MIDLVSKKLAELTFKKNAIPGRNGGTAKPKLQAVLQAIGQRVNYRP